MASEPFNSGSQWLRWEPHIHTPGTQLNDQFKCDWDQYFNRIETSDPPIKALGVTDYYLTDNYERVRQEKKNGRLSDCDLIFPNIEMRLDIGTSAKCWVNIHLLVCPDEADHLNKIQQFLRQLQFQTANQTYVCDKDGLTSLGKLNGTDDENVALRRGVEQFKVNIDKLIKAYAASEWAKANILVAVSGGSDGTSGVNESADRELRKKIETFAHIIFIGNPNDRAFWLGESKAPAEELESDCGGLKLCLHGSDAHCLSQVGQPDLNRYCWIKGSATFDGLRYACITPHRGFIGELPPASEIPSQIIKSVKITNAPWINTPDLEFNSGLITIIGARGSGKTALADMIAAGCDAIRPDDRSFLRRAEGKLGQAKVELTWANDEKAQCQLESVDTFNHGNEPKATYLSQQFVDKLCASDEIADDLLREMERVIFESHAFATRGAAHDFNSLKTAKVGSSSNQRRDAERAIADLSERIADALEVKCKIPLVREKIQHQQGVIANYETDKQNLAPSGSDENQTRFNQINEAINNANLRIAGLTEKKSALEDLQNEVKCFRQEFAREMLHDLKSSFAIADLSDDEWKEFGTDFIGDVDNLLKGKLEPLKKQIKDQQGSPVCLPTDDGDDSTALIQDLADLDKQPLSLLAAEADRLSRILGENKAADDRFKTVLDRLRRETRNLQGLKAELREYQDKEGQIQELAQQRSNKLGIVIKAVLAEENALHSIYKPLAKKLQNSDGVLRKLTFSVKRHIDLEDWAKRGEDLLDLRSAGKFRFKGTLVNRAKQELAGIWQTGNETEILKALNKFQTCHRDNLLKHSPYQQGTAEHRDWLTQFAKWIFDTSYVSFQYSMAYDGTDIRQLSPGNRGIVMLLLYLELDENNGKPLIIDQPEENLDPKSIQSELVPLFERAKKRRQIFMVTHNANLVVNTDAEQVIVANLGAREKDKLPPISYESGGLEDASIREKVCEVLEGGEAAFKERAKRLQITLSR